MKELESHLVNYYLIPLEYLNPYSTVKLNFYKLPLTKQQPRVKATSNVPLADDLIAGISEEGLRGITRNMSLHQTTIALTDLV